MSAVANLSIEQIQERIRMVQVQRRSTAEAMKRSFGFDDGLEKLLIQYEDRIHVLEGQVINLEIDRANEQMAYAVSARKAAIQIKELQDRLDAANRQVASSADRILELERELAVKSGKILQLQDELDGKNDQLVVRDDRLNDGGQERERMQRRIDQLERDLVSVRQELADRHELDRLIMEERECFLTIEQSRKYNNLVTAGSFILGFLCTPFLAIPAALGAEAATKCCDPKLKKAKERRSELSREIGELRQRIGDPPPLLLLPPEPSPMEKIFQQNQMFIKKIRA
jgi:chromosome segregation ATPase